MGSNPAFPHGSTFPGNWAGADAYSATSAASERFKRSRVGTDATAMSTPETSAASTPEPSWSDRYGDKHRWLRFVAFPAGLAAPQKVRVYQRAGHFLLNWWDPGEKKNRSE